MNILEQNEAFQETSNLLKSLGHPVRLQILKAIGSGEACVCHLEAHLDIRQAYLSQHLMALREAGVLDTRRDGRYIYYRIIDKQILEVIDDMAMLAGVTMQASNQKHQKCDCPKCCGD